MAYGAIKTLVTNKGIVTAATKGLINYADIQNVADGKVLGRTPGNSSGPITELDLSTLNGITSCYGETELAASFNVDNALGVWQATTLSVTLPTPGTYL